jgi:hypothetical protein
MGSNRERGGRGEVSSKFRAKKIQDRNDFVHIL